MSLPSRSLSLAAGWIGTASPATEWRDRLAAALGRESEERRFFLWLPVAAIGGVALNLAADHEPALGAPAALLAAAIILGALLRRRPGLRGIAFGIAALIAGFIAMGLRTERLRAPVLDHIRIVTLKGYVEAVDF